MSGRATEKELVNTMNVYIDVAFIIVAITSIKPFRTYLSCMH